MGESRRGTTDYTDSWERSAPHEITRINRIKKTSAKKLGVFTRVSWAKESAAWSARTKVTKGNSRKIPDDAPRIGSGD